MPNSPMSVMQSVSVPSDPPAGSGRRQRWSRACLVAGLVTAIVAAVGVAGRARGYLIVDELTGHLGAALLLALILFLLAALLAPVTGGLRKGARLVVALGLGLSIVVVSVASVFSADFGQSRYDSPDGRSVLVVTEGAAMIDPVWTVTVRQSSRALARTWVAGCFNGDDPVNALKSVRWLSPTLVEAVAGSGGKYQITIDPTDSRPANIISVGCDSSLPG